jgi:Fe-S-cluster containining protein
MKYGKKIECKRCGTCCLANLIAFVTDEDIERWKREQREDILRILDNKNAVWAGDRLISMTNGQQLYGCPFLMWEKNHYTCTIYETRPQVCRDYIPGSSHICPYYKKSDEDL